MFILKPVFLVFMLRASQQSCACVGTYCVPTSSVSRRNLKVKNVIRYVSVFAVLMKIN